MKRSLGPITLVYPMPIFLIGAYDQANRPNIMAAAWAGVCCSEPPLLAVSIRKQRWTYDALINRKGFTVSIPSAKMAAETDFAGMASGRNTDKFKELNLTPVKAEFTDAPYVGECPVVLELALFSQTDLGSHAQFIGEIKDVKVSENCLDDNGKPVIEKINPLIYDGGSRTYLQVGSEVGKAFADGKMFRQASDE